MPKRRNFDLSKAIGKLDSRKSFESVSFNKSMGNRLTPKAIEDLLQSREFMVANATFMICGPDPYRMMILDTLNRLGIENHRIRFESFGNGGYRGQSDSSPKTLVKKPLPKEARAASIRFKTEAGIRVVESFKGESILDAGLRGGVPIMHSCKSGICSLCKLKCSDGNVVDEEGIIYSTEFLSCRTFPSTSQVIIG